MNRDEALQVIAPLVSMCGSWSEPSIEGMVVELERLTEVEAAHEATALVVRNWDGAGRPTLAYWLSAYQTCARRHQDARQALPPHRQETIPAVEYLRRLRERADRGDGQARRELDGLYRVAQSSLASRSKRQRLGAPVHVGSLLAEQLGIDHDQETAT